MMRTRIEISGIPNQPIGYKITILTDDRPQLMGVHEELFLTEGRVKLVGKSQPENHLIQALTYDKYVIKVVKTESFRIEWLRYAKSVRVISGTKVLTAKITAVSLEDIEGSSFKNAVIEFYDIAEGNYNNGTFIQNYLRSDYLSDTYDTYQLIRLILNINAEVFTFYTMQEPELFATAPEENVINVAGIEVQTSASIKKYKKVYFYLNNEDLQEFMYNVPICDGINNKAIIASSGTSISITERPKYEYSVVSGAIDLFKVSINFVYNSRKEFNYGI